MLLLGGVDSMRRHAQEGGDGLWPLVQLQAVDQGRDKVGSDAAHQHSWLLEGLEDMAFKVVHDGCTELVRGPSNVVLEQDASA